MRVSKAMAEVKILVRGYAWVKNGVWFASPNTTLIKDQGYLVIVDPGANAPRLLSALKKEGLKPKDIDIVFLTHYHLDHILNIRLFPDHDIHDGNTINRGDKIIEYKKVIPATGIQVISTPGHAFEHCSLLVQTKKGKIAIAGDVFWWADKDKPKLDYQSLVNRRDPYAKDWQQLKASRKRLLALADYIIPGHGKMFRVQ